MHASMQSHFIHAQLFANPWARARQAPLSMGFSRQEYWSGLPCPSPEVLPNPGIKPRDRTQVSCIAGRFFTVWATREAHATILQLCMCVCVCVCIHTCICVCVYTHTYTHVYICVCIHTYVYMCARTCTHVHVCERTRVCIHTYIHTCICVCMRVYIYVIYIILPRVPTNLLPCKNWILVLSFLFNLWWFFIGEKLQHFALNFIFITLKSKLFFMFIGPGTFFHVLLRFCSKLSLSWKIYHLTWA